MKSDSDNLDVERAWEEHPNALRQFIDARSNYEALCSEVAYILENKLTAAGIRSAAITKRAKTLKSFAEKISRKHYKGRLDEITDLAGVRVVFLYKKDRRAIERLIEDEFEIIEKVDKNEDRNPDSFGYGALHYLVHIGKKSSGARYDDLKGLICEIQVRTVLQDAWAIFDHHLSYKQEADIPSVLRRKINSLAGLFETADDHFDQLNVERRKYLKRIKKTITGKTKSTQQLNVDSFRELLRNRFPTLPEGNAAFAAGTLENLRRYGYHTFADLDNLLARTQKARRAMANEQKPAASASQVNRAVALENAEFRKVGWRPPLPGLFKKYAHLVEKRLT
jgi:putative GTP pyrophosphokinase